MDYCYYIYVTALVRDEDPYTDYARDTIEFYIRSELKDRWEPVIMADKLGLRRGKRVTQVYRDMRDYYERSREIPGALFLAEALNLVNDDPALLHEMGPLEIALLFWGVRKEALGREAAYRFAELVSRMRVYRAECRDAMIALCKVYETKPILEAALNQLILGNNTDARWNKWYKLGIDSELKIPKLYEYYMESLDITSPQRGNIELPSSARISTLSAFESPFSIRYLIFTGSDTFLPGLACTISTSLLASAKKASASSPIPHLTDFSDAVSFKSQPPHSLQDSLPIITPAGIFSTIALPLPFKVILSSNTTSFSLRAFHVSECSLFKRIILSLLSSQAV